MTDYFAHASAFVDEGAQIGAGTRIWHFCHIMPGARIGERCSLGQNVVVMPGTRIGNNVKIQNNVSRKSEYQRTLVRRGASIGANATIVCGVSLGEYAFIGAGAVVTSDVPPYALMVGVPARRVGWMCQCGERLRIANGRATCARCGTSYREADGQVRPD
jgi:UDP-2-acetamido-3-amino-2,3-dideoxy-glucuronate N-acetyltransferase